MRIALADALRVSGDVVRARAMAEAWDEAAEPCHIDALAVQKAAA